MGFVSGVVLGLAFGIALVFGFAHYGNIRSRRRSDLATTVAAFARMTVDDSRKLLRGEYYPSWVVFTQRQKLTWLNLQLKKIWPYVDAAASEIIRASVEPVLEQYKPIVLSSLTFSKLTLGTVAPQFTGVEVLDSKKEAGEVVMELELKWDGNPNIELDMRTRVGVSLPVQVKDIGFTGVFRIIFKPLVDTLPCFGAICYSLREKKNLDFRLKIAGGDISAVPGIADAIEETIRDAIEDTLTWPVQKILPTIPGDYRFLELKPVGTLEVKLVQARELMNKDLVGKSDPYAVLFVRPLRSRMKTSKVINNQINPIWNEHFEFVVEDASTQNLTIRVFDDEGVQASELIGCAQVSLKTLEPGMVKDVWLKLVKNLEVQQENKNRGLVQLELLYCPFGTDSAIKNPFRSDVSLTLLERVLGAGPKEVAAVSSPPRKKNVIVRGVLSVTVIAAENLPVTDILGKSDPYVVLMMKKSEVRHKTRVVNNVLNPVWDQTFDIVVEDGLHDMLIVEVLDHNTFRKTKIGKCIMTLTRVILEGQVQDSFHLDGAKSGKVFLHLKWTPQPIFLDS